MEGDCGTRHLNDVSWGWSVVLSKSFCNFVEILQETFTMKNFKRIILIALSVFTVATCASALELADFTLSQSRAHGIPATQPARKGSTYYQMSSDGTKIFECGYQSDVSETTVFDTGKLQGCTVDYWDGYTMSDLENKILLWTNVHMIYRHSFKADYYVYDVASGKIAQLSQAGGEEIATFSPDGNQVAYVVNNNVYIKNLVDGTVVTVTTDGAKNEVINGVPDWVYQEEFGMLNSLVWSPNSKTLAFLRFDESKVPMYSMPLYEGDCDANSQFSLYPGSYDYKYPVAGENNSVVSVMAYDVAGKQLSRMNVPTVERDYIPHIDFADDNSKLMVSTLNRTQNDFHIYAVDPAKSHAVEVYHETSDSWIDSELANMVTYYDNFFIMPSEKSGYTQLYFCSLDGKQQIQFTRGNENVTQYYGFDAKRQRFYYQTTAGPLNRQIKYVDEKGVHHDLTPAQGTYNAIFSSDFSYHIRTFSDQHTPTQYVIYNHKGKKVRELEMNREYAAKYTGSSVPKREFFTCNSDGYTLNGFMIKPVNFDPDKKYPVIMVQYSGPNSQQVLNRWGLDWQEYAASEGFIVACVDGRGTGGRGKAFQSVVYQKLGHYESIDQIVAAAHMASLPYVDKDRIGIWGWSYGGYETLMAMSTPGSNFACGVAIAPVTSWKFYDTIYAERYMRTPQENPEGFKDGSPLEAVDKLKGKVLIMFGSADDNVHVINAMQYMAKLHGQHRQFDLMVFPNMNHSINGCDIRLPLYQYVMDFYRRNLK